MTEDNQVSSEVQREADLVSDPILERFYQGAMWRISRYMIAIATILTAVAGLMLGWRIALGFLCGAAIAYLNFYWLEKVVSTLADRATQSGQAQSSTGVVSRFLLRYALMALAAYAILTVSPVSIRGLFAGLFLPVAAIACEAVYELYRVLRSGF